MDEKRIEWMGSSKKDLLAMPKEVVNRFGHALGLAQNGMSPSDAKTLTQFKTPIVELLENHDGDTYRAMYTARFYNVIYVLHCFKKKSPKGSALPKRDKETIESRLTDATAIETAKIKSKGFQT